MDDPVAAKHSARPTDAQRPAVLNLVVVADLAGIFLSASAGAAVAMAAGLDLLGVLVVAFISALGGGVVRDVLIGAVPPKAFSDWRYAGAAFVAGAVTFAGLAISHHIPGPILVWIEAADLALFSVAGAEKALAYGLPSFSAVLMAGVTGVGGGVMRDVLLNHVPHVLLADVYATAALVGATVLVVCLKLGLGSRASAILGGLSCFVLRLLAVWLHWNLPVAMG